MRILFITSKVFPGICSVGNHGRGLGLWDLGFVEGGLPSLADYDGVILAGTLVQGFDVQNAFKDMIVKCNAADVPVGVLCTSSIGQMEFTLNIEPALLLSWLGWLEKREIDFLFVGSKDLYELVKADRVRHFSYPVMAAAFEKSQHGLKIPDSVGLFLPGHPRKNVQNQVAAVILAGRVRPGLRGYTNLKNYLDLNPEIFEIFGWLPDIVEYWSVVSKMKIVLHVSHTESYAYAVAEAVSLGTLPIISQTIRDNLGLPQELVVRNPDSALEIASRITQILELSDVRYAEVLASAKAAFGASVAVQNAALRRLLDECFDVDKHKA